MLPRRFVAWIHYRWRHTAGRHSEPLYIGFRPNPPIRCVLFSEKDARRTERGVFSRQKSQRKQRFIRIVRARATLSRSCPDSVGSDDPRTRKKGDSCVRRSLVGVRELLRSKPASRARSYHVYPGTWFTLVGVILSDSRCWKCPGRGAERRAATDVSSRVGQESGDVGKAGREFGISRQTGYKRLNRYDEQGVYGFENGSGPRVLRVNPAWRRRDARGSDMRASSLIAGIRIVSSQSTIPGVTWDT
jgi:hypothetical protein